MKAPVVTKADVDCEEDGSEDDSNGGEHTHDSIDDGVDGQELLYSLIARWSTACTVAIRFMFLTIFVYLIYTLYVFFSLHQIYFTVLHRVPKKN